MKVKYFAYIRDYTKAKETEIEYSGNLRGLLEKLSVLYGEKFKAKMFKEDGELSSEIIILVNGRHIAHLNYLDTKLNGSDEISIFPVVAGG